MEECRLARADAVPQHEQLPVPRRESRHDVVHLVIPFRGQERQLAGRDRTGLQENIRTFVIGHVHAEPIGHRLVKQDRDRRELPEFVV